jgi:hypothetical protein
MKFLTPVLLSLLSAIIPFTQGSYNYTSPTGFHYTLTKTQHGVEVPVTPPPPLNSTRHGLFEAGSRPASNATRKNLKRDLSVTGNWCGLAQLAPPSGEVWSEVHGTFQIPVLTTRDGQSYTEQPGIGQWVGLDGGCGSEVLVQGGTESQVSGSVDWEIGAPFSGTLIRGLSGFRSWCWTRYNYLRGIQLIIFPACSWGPTPTRKAPMPGSSGFLTPPWSWILQVREAYAGYCSRFMG